LPEANSKRLQALGLEQVRKLCPTSEMSSADQDHQHSRGLGSNKKKAQHKKSKKTTPKP